MQYFSIDIETTGLDRENHQVLEIGVIAEDTLDQKDFHNIPKFHAILYHPQIVGHPYALNMNKSILHKLAVYSSIKDENELVDYAIHHNITTPHRIAKELNEWLFNVVNNRPMNYHDPIEIVVAGKNFASFDKVFLEKLPDFTKYVKFHHRTIDPVTLYTDFIEDKAPVNLNTCLERAGIDTVVGHDAIGDAWDVIQVLRKKYDKIYPEDHLSHHGGIMTS